MYQILPQHYNRVINITIAILGLHPILICLCKLVYPIAEWGVVNYFTGLVVMVVSLNIIKSSKKRFSKLIGIQHK